MAHRGCPLTGTAVKPSQPPVVTRAALPDRPEHATPTSPLEDRRRHEIRGPGGPDSVTALLEAPGDEVPA